METKAKIITEAIVGFIRTLEMEHDVAIVLCVATQGKTGCATISACTCDEAQQSMLVAGLRAASGASESYNAMRMQTTSEPNQLN